MKDNLLRTTITKGTCQQRFASTLISDLPCRTVKQSELKHVIDSGMHVDGEEVRHG